MKDVERMKHDLSDLIANNEPLVWAGDFNSLTRKDYSKANWEAVTSERNENNWELPKTEVRLLPRELQGAGRELHSNFSVSSFLVSCF